LAKTQVHVPRLVAGDLSANAGENSSSSSRSSTGIQESPTTPQVFPYIYRWARAERGYEVDQIANDIGMSRQNIEHCMRFKDRMNVGADDQKRRRLVNSPEPKD
jgi:hypothetical protein